MASSRTNIKLRGQKIITFFNSGIEINLINKKHAQVFGFFYTVDNRLRLINMNNYITVIFDIYKNEKIFINLIKIK